MNTGKIFIVAIFGILCIAITAFMQYQIATIVYDYATSNEYYTPIVACNDTRIVVKTPTCGDINTRVASSSCDTIIGDIIAVRHNPNTCSVYYDFNMVFKILPSLSIIISCTMGVFLAYNYLKKYDIVVYNVDKKYNNKYSKSTERAPIMV